MSETSHSKGECWEGCLAYVIEGEAGQKILDVRKTVLERHTDVPSHLQLPPHLTVKYLGYHPLSLLERLFETLLTVKAIPLSLTATKIGLFHYPHGACNLHLRLPRHTMLLALQAEAQHYMKRLGCIDRDRFSGSRYVPHITVVDQVRISDKELSLLQEILPFEAALSSLILFKKPYNKPVLPGVIKL